MPTTLVRTVGQARELVDYNRAVFDRFYRQIARLPRKAVFADRGIGHRSLFGTLVHILNVHEVWLVYIVPGRTGELPERFQEADRHPTDWPGLRRYATRVWAGVDATVDRLRSSDLRRPVRAPWMSGEYTAGDGFLQPTFEEAHHLGEIIGALWRDDVETSRMTWIEVTRRKTPRARGSRPGRARRA